MEREKDEVVQRKTQLEQVRKLYHAAKRDYAGTDEKLALVEKDASAAEKILKQVQKGQRKQDKDKREQEVSPSETGSTNLFEGPSHKIALKGQVPLTYDAIMAENQTVKLKKALGAKSDRDFEQKLLEKRTRVRRRIAREEADSEDNGEDDDEEEENVLDPPYWWEQVEATCAQPGAEQEDEERSEKVIEVTKVHPPPARGVWWEGGWLPR